jgi:hypothetical protein
VSIDTAAADGLKVLDLKRPIREADMTEIYEYAPSTTLADFLA